MEHDTFVLGSNFLTRHRRLSSNFCRGAVPVLPAHQSAGGGHPGVAVAVEPAVPARRAQADADHAQAGLPPGKTGAPGEENQDPHGTPTKLACAWCPNTEIDFKMTLLQTFPDHGACQRHTSLLASSTDTCK
jgi:hypothetical protein